MKLFSIFLILCSSLCLTPQSAESVRTEYYSSIAFRESPFPDQKGIIALSQDDALTRKHYRFEFDEHQRILRISFWHKDMRTDPNHTANHFFPTSYQKIDYHKGQEIVSYYDRFNNRISDGTVYQAIYQLDELGRRIQLHFEDDQGRPTENEWNIVVYQWAIQEDGSVIEERYDLEERVQPLRTGFPFHRVRLCYNVDGYISLMQNIDSLKNLVNNSTGVAQDVLYFDAQGRWLGWKVLDAKGNNVRGNGPNVARGVNIPDEYGYEVSLTNFDEQGQCVQNAYGFYVGKRTYDRYGNYDITWFEDGQGKKSLNPSTGYAMAIYEWEEDGKILESISFFDEQDHPVLRMGGYHKMEFSYYQNGNLKSRRYLGLDQELINRADNGVAEIRYEYDQNHIRIGSKNYSKEGFVK